MAAAAAWQPTPSLSNPSAYQQFVSSANQYPSTRAQKRRHDSEDDVDTIRQVPAIRDTSMDRSPTPERPKRSAPKRARVTYQLDSTVKDESEVKENKDPSTLDDHEVDVGVLLASLPPQSLLSILTSLLKVQPSLKSTILPLMPRPTLETATHALSQSAKKLRDAYPYSSGATFGNNGMSSFGKTSVANNSNGGMRDSYIISRLRPHVADFVAACFSYLPYFSLSSTTQDSIHKGKCHPSETFLFLSTMTKHIIGQPPLTQSQLMQQLLPRLSEEWKAWVMQVDEIVNQQGGMFGSETVRSWERALDEMAGEKFEGAEMMGTVRDVWVSKVGWLVGRQSR